MPVVRLTSKSNPLIRMVRLVASQARKAPPDLVLAEGLRVLEEATCSPFPIKLALVSEGYGRFTRESALLSAWSRSSIRTYQVADSLMKSLSEVLSPQGALALVRVPRRKLCATQLGSHPLLVSACGVRDPGNLGMLLRTARATGASLLCTTSGTVSVRNPKAVRASAGAIFHIPVVEDVRPEVLRRYFTDEGIRAYRTSAQEGDPCWEVDLSVPSAILLGNESRGVEEQAWRDLPLIRVPMAVGAESLNVAAAGAIIMYEAWRQRSLSRRQKTES
jgi:TrmH family RNA methyltransferase